MPEPKRKATGIEAFEVDYEDVDEDEAPDVTTVHLIEKWGTGHPPKDRIRRRTLEEEDKATPDTNGGYTTYTRGYVTIDGYAFEVKEMSGSQVADNFDDAKEGDVRWWLRPIDFEDGHGGKSPRWEAADEDDGDTDE